MVDLTSFPDKWRVPLQNLIRPQFLARVVLAGKVILGLGVLIFLILSVMALLDGVITSSLGGSSLANTSAEPENTLPDKPAKVNYKIIGERNIFGAQPTPTPQPVDAPPPPSELPLQLIGTIITKDSEPLAIIENTKDKFQDVYNTGDRVVEDAIISKIMAMAVEIDRNGRKEILKLIDEDILPEVGEGGVAVAGEDRFIVDEAELDRSLENLPLLLSQARAVPYFKDGKAIGLRLFAIKPESMFEKIGLKNGDIIKDINGKSLADTSQALKLFEELKSERSLKVQLERNREDKEFYYEIR